MLNFQVATRYWLPVLLASAGFVTLTAATVRADEIAPVLQEPAQAAQTPGAQPSAGGYGGVTPGATGSNPLPQPPPGSSPYLIWTGFQPTTTGSRVFFQTTAPVEFEMNPGRVSKGKSILSVTLRGCRIHMANNRRQLDTRAFPTPVQSVLAKQHGKNVELVIALREAAPATSGTEAGPNGSGFVFLDFPPGKASPIEGKPPVRAEAESGSPTSGEGWSLSEDASKRKPNRRASKSGEPSEAGKALEPGVSPGSTAQ